LNDIKAILEKNILLDSNEFVMFFNELFLDAKHHLTIKDALYGLELFEVTISDQIEIEILIDLDLINQNKKKIPTNAQNEFPSKSRFFEVFLKSGLFFNKYYRNSFDHILRDMAKVNPLNGDLPIAISFDTNLYYNQFFSQLYPMLLEKYGAPRFPIKFLMSEGVKKELTRYEKKYKQKDIDDLKKVVKYPLIIQDFFNQSTLTSRLWHLGHSDFLKCIANVNYKFVDEDTSVNHNDMDNKIINGLLKEIKQQNIKLHILSQDSDFIARSRGNKNLVPIFLDRIPNSKLKLLYSISWEKFVRFIYTLSVTFGAIVLEFNDKSVIVIQGIWRGKKLFHWENETMKVCSINNLISKIEKDLTILRNIKLEEGVN